MKPRFVTVYQQAGIYAGWPANHGAWQWGDEFLVGFLRGAYDGVGNGAGHRITPPYHKWHARSRDGGESWTIEQPNVDFAGSVHDAPQVFNPNNPDNIIRVCGNYDTGGEDCHQLGAFYLSRDRGVVWTGPYAFVGLEGVFGGSDHCTARTRVVGNQVFLSVANRRQWGTDTVFVATYQDGRFIFNFGNDVVLGDHYRAVMPAVAIINDRTIVALRRKGLGRNWIDIVIKKGGGPWQLLAQPNELQGVAGTGKHNGNPPALASFGKRLVCTFANRSEKALLAIVSDNLGETWSEPIVLEKGECSDVGYPQLLKRADGLAVCVYYWTAVNNEPEHPQHIRACIFDPFNM